MHGVSSKAWADQLGISSEAVELYRQSDVIDLHIDSFIWHRVFGYDLTKRHGHGLFGARFYSQVDFPRVLEAELAGATWVITTNPARDARDRLDTFRRNLASLLELFDRVSDHFQVVRNFKEYQAARALGKHAAFLGIQGGNAFDANLDALKSLDGVILRITLVHLSSSRLGATSSPLRFGADLGLSSLGRKYVEQLNHERILVDLAHISPRGFWDAVAVHDPNLPLIVTHTGLSGVHPHWRNIDDAQLRQVAQSGGTVGVIFHTAFLGGLFTSRAEAIVRHLAHIVDTVGEDHASFGSDWDGAIFTPRDLPTCLELPRLVQLMLDRNWSPERIRKILGGNFLRVVKAIRG